MSYIYAVNPIVERGVSSYRHGLVKKKSQKPEYVKPAIYATIPYTYGWGQFQPNAITKYVTGGGKRRARVRESKVVGRIRGRGGKIEKADIIDYLEEAKNVGGDVRYETLIADIMHESEKASKTEQEKYDTQIARLHQELEEERAGKVEVKGKGKTYEKYEPPEEESEEEEAKSLVTSPASIDAENEIIALKETIRKTQDDLDKFGSLMYQTDEEKEALRKQLKFQQDMLRVDEAITDISKKIQKENEYLNKGPRYRLQHHGNRKLTEEEETKLSDDIKKHMKIIDKYTSSLEELKLKKSKIIISPFTPRSPAHRVPPIGGVPTALVGVTTTTTTEPESPKTPVMRRIASAFSGKPSTSTPQKK